MYFIEYDLGDSELICLRIADGSEVWSSPLPTGTWPFPSTLAAAFDFIYFVTKSGGSPENGTLAAYAASTGGLVWQVGLAIGYGGTPSPAIGFGNVYVGTAQGLRAFDAISGAPKWSASGLPGNGASTPVIVSDVGVGNPAVVAIATTDQTLRGYDATNGSLLWEFISNRPILGLALATDSGKIYLNQRKTIVVLDAVAGTVIVTSPDLGADVASSPTMTKDRVIIIMSDDRIVALNRPGLSVEDEVGIPSASSWYGPSVEGGHLYVNVASGDAPGLAAWDTRSRISQEEQRTHLLYRNGGLRVPSCRGGGVFT